MFTATFNSPEEAQFIANIIRPYGVKQPTTVNSLMTIDDEALEILAEIDSETDGHYDGECIWIGGTPRAVSQIGRTRKGTTISLRVPQEDLDTGARLADRLGIDRTELLRRYIHDGIARTITLISANPGDLVPGRELAECDGESWITALMEHPKVREFFAANNYGPDHDDELMYALIGDGSVPDGFPTLTIILS